MTNSIIKFITKNNLISFFFCLIFMISCNKKDESEDFMYPENIHIGDVTILNQQELEDFGAQKYTKIQGFLKISGATDLSSLDALKEIDDDFLIGYLDSDIMTILSNPELKSLNGIENLLSVGGELGINYNSKIKKIDLFLNLQTVGEINIFHNDSLVNCSNFNNLTQIKERIFISVNPELTIIEFENLEKVGLSMNNNDNGITISSHELQNLSFQNLITIGNKLTISVRNIDSMNFTKLNSIDGTLYLYKINSINSLNQFSNLESVGNLRINKCNSLTDLDGLINLKSINDDIDIWENNSLTNLNGLANVSSIYGGIYIDTNPLLTNFCGLNNTPFNGSYDVFDNGYNPTISQLNSSQNCSN